MRSNSKVKMNLNVEGFRQLLLDLVEYPLDLEAELEKRQLSPDNCHAILKALKADKCITDEELGMICDQYGLYTGNVKNSAEHIDSVLRMRVINKLKAQHNSSYWQLFILSKQKIAHDLRLAAANLETEMLEVQSCLQDLQTILLAQSFLDD